MAKDPPNIGGFFVHFAGAIMAVPAPNSHKVKPFQKIFTKNSHFHFHPDFPEITISAKNYHPHAHLTCGLPYAATCPNSGPRTSA
jgi:hypothetical protein